MSIFSLSLLFMSPVIAYATYLLLNENRDPLKGFHDDFLRNFHSQQKDFLSLENRNEVEINDKSKKRNQKVFIVFSFAIAILFNHCLNAANLSFNSSKAQRKVCLNFFLNFHG